MPGDGSQEFDDSLTPDERIRSENLLKSALQPEDEPEPSPSLPSRRQSNSTEGLTQAETPGWVPTHPVEIAAIEAYRQANGGIIPKKRTVELDPPNGEFSGDLRRQKQLAEGYGKPEDVKELLRQERIDRWLRYPLAIITTMSKDKARQKIDLNKYYRYTRVAIRGGLHPLSAGIEHMPTPDTINAPKTPRNLQ